MAEDTKSPIATQLLNTLPSAQPSDSFYTLIVNGDNQGFDSVTRYIPIDLVTNVSVSGSSDITTYPLLSGDIISDHKYDNPRSVEISGTFALNGKYASMDNTTFAFNGNKSSRLKNIEDYFFALRKYGKFISLVSSLNGENRFSTIDNLAISNLRFDRNFNTLKFFISLKEIYTYQNDNELDILENASDPNLPVLGSFKSCDFARDVFSYDAIDEMTITQLADNGMIDQSFAESIYDVLKTEAITFMSVGAAIVLFVILVKVLAKLAIISATTATMLTSGASTIAAMGSIPVVGWVVLGVTAVVALVGLGITIWKSIKRLSLINEFKGYDNETQNIQESERFYNVLNAVRSAFNKVAKNNNIKFYSFSSNSAKQTTYLTIDDNVYQFNAEQISNGWSLKVINTSDDDSVVQTKNTSRLVGFSSLFSLKNTDAIFHTNKKTYVYVLNKAYAYETYSDEDLKTMLVDAWKNGKLGFLGYTTQEMKNVDNIPEDEILARFKNEGIYKDLTQFVFVVTNVKLTELEKALKDTIYNCFKKEVYE